VSLIFDSSIFEGLSFHPTSTRSINMPMKSLTYQIARLSLETAQTLTEHKLAMPMLQNLRELVVKNQSRSHLFLGPRLEFIRMVCLRPSKSVRTFTLSINTHCLSLQNFCLSISVPWIICGQLCQASLSDEPDLRASILVFWLQGFWLTSRHGRHSGVWTSMRRELGISQSEVWAP
jgi:hypothetical protein